MVIQRDISRVSVVTAATSSPLTVAEIKDHLRISQDAEDTKLENALAAAVNELTSPQGWLGRSVMSQTLRLTLDAPPPRVLRLPGPPTTVVKKIVTRGSDDTLTTIYDSDAAVDTIGLLTDLTAEPALIWPDDDIGWPSDIKHGPDSMRIDYITGYADAASVPKVIKQWLLMRVGELYRDPEASVLAIGSTALKHADRMLDNWRIHS